MVEGADAAMLLLAVAVVPVELWPLTSGMSVARAWRGDAALGRSSLAQDTRTMSTRRPCQSPYASPMRLLSVDVARYTIGVRLSVVMHAHPPPACLSCQLRVRRAESQQQQHQRPAHGASTALRRQQ